MFKLPDLPYAYDALSPTIGETTMRTHHDKHHRKYVDTLNTLVAEAGAKPQSLEAVIREAESSGKTKLANNAGQAWNHGFFWESMAPKAGKPADALMKAIEAFGGMDKLKSELVAQGVAHFGSGWVWLVADKGKLQITTTHDGKVELPAAGRRPILTCDLWEHAYYLDYKNDREGFLKAWFDELANWSFAEAQFAAVTRSGQGYQYPAPTLAKAA
jgi:Fe-Mn family superoxide dismutase